MTYQDAIQFLFQLRQFGTKLGLDNTNRLAALCGNPQFALRFIHVAGTNGKGSTCAMLESIYRAAGLKTGLFTSPHLVSFTERMQVNREAISEPDVVRLVENLLRRISEENTRAAEPLHPTFFEFVTVMALEYFREQKCDLILWEVGMGGRLDATNIVTPLASVITNIQYDHQRWLGDTLPQIAFEKAGIIKKGVPVITGVEDESALEVISRIAGQEQAPLYRASPHSTIPPLEEVELPLKGEHQLKNAAVALKTVQVLQAALPVSVEALKEGLKNTKWAGRLQLVERSPGRRILLDGAHNLDGVRSLRAALQQYFPEQEKTLIIGMFSDKAWREMAGQIVPLGSRILICPVQSQRSTTTEELAQACREINPSGEIVECRDIRHAIKLATDAPFTVLTGSLHFIGEAMEALGLNPAGKSDERGLNEWDAAGQR